MITFRFSGRTPTPNTYKIGQENDQNAETLRFLLPQIADSQTAQLVMLLPDGTPEALNILGGLATVSTAMTEQPGRITAWVEIEGSGSTAWNSEVFYLEVGDLPPATEITERAYPTAIQDALDAATRAVEIYRDMETLNGLIQEAVEALTLIESMVITGTELPTGGTEGQYLKKKSAINYDAEWASFRNTIQTVNCGTISSLPVTIQSAGVNVDMILIQADLGTPSAQQSDWTVTTADGSVTVNGTISGSTTLKLYFVGNISAGIASTYSVATFGSTAFG